MTAEGEILHERHDNERIFLMLEKIQTEHRSELANDTICSLIYVKQNQNMECYEYSMTAEGEICANDIFSLNI
jgi:hypothetical protein